MKTSNEVPTGASDLACYNGERIPTVSIWFLDIETKRMIQARSTNIEGLVLRALRFIQTGKGERLGVRLKAFLTSILKSGQRVYWIKNGYATEKVLLQKQWIAMSRYPKPEDALSRKVMISGKVLKIEHLKSHFTFFSAVETNDFKAAMLRRLTRVCTALPSQEWKNENEVLCFLERFTKAFGDSEVRRSDFVASFVEMTTSYGHIAFVRSSNQTAVVSWLERKGFKRKCNQSTERNH